MCKSQIANSKSQIPNNQDPKPFFSPGALVLLIICNLLFASCNSALCAQISNRSEKEEEAVFVAKKALEDGFYDVALRLFGQFLKDYPNSPKAAEAQLLIGQCYFHQNNFPEALSKFEWLLNQSMANKIQDGATYWIAEVHFRANNFSKASQYYRRVIDDFPNSGYAPSATYSLGWCSFQEHAFSDALKYFQIVEEKYPKEPFAKEATFKIIECLYNIKDYAVLKERIKSYLKNYSQENAKSAYLYFYLAESEYYLNDFSGALDSYAKVMQITNDEKMQNLSKLGSAWAYLKLKKYDSAENLFSSIQAANLERSSKDVFFLGKAILMMETKRYDEAKRIYDELAATTEEPLVSLQAYLGQADAFYNMGRYKDAIEVYKQASQRISSDTDPELIDKLHYGFAWAYLKDGQFKEAIDEFQKIVKQSEDKIIKVSALCQIGDAYQDSGEYSKAMEAYDSILKDYPDSLYSDYVQYQLGVAMLKVGNYDGAVLAFQNLKHSYRASKLLDDASYALGLSYFQRQDYNASRDIFEKFQDEFKDSYLKSQALYLLGSSLYNLGKFQEAVEVFKSITKMYSSDTELVQKAEYEIADCFYRMGEEKQALEKFKALRAKYPDSSLTAETIWWLAEYYYRHDTLDLARRYFTSLTQDFSKSNLVPNAYYALGTISESQSKYDEALSNFEKVTEFGKSDLAGTSMIAAAGVYVKQQKYDLALKTYNDVIDNYQNLVSLVYPKMGDVYQKTGDYNKAVEFYRKSLDIVPIDETGTIQFKIAETRETEGKSDQAIEEYLKVSYLHPQESSLAVKSLLRVASIYEGKDNFKEALNIYKKIAAMNVEEAKYANERIEWIKLNIRGAGIR